jgi:hypothetical protein
MAATMAETFITSDVPDIQDQPLYGEACVDDGEYAQLMRRIGIIEGEPGTTVSAFNSSI